MAWLFWVWGVFCLVFFIGFRGVREWGVCFWFVLRVWEGRWCFEYACISSSLAVVLFLVWRVCFRLVAFFLREEVAGGRGEIVLSSKS